MAIFFIHDTMVKSCTYEKSLILVKIRTLSTFFRVLESANFLFQQIPSNKSTFWSLLRKLNIKKMREKHFPYFPLPLSPSHPHFLSFRSCGQLFRV